MIELERISKKFCLYPNRKDRLKEWLTFGRKVYHQDVWALRDISLKIPKGEVFGLVGMNGAGKSTLLKIITKTMAPTSGHMSLQGRVAALLELGTGFHPELSGRDNVMVNGRLLGLAEADIKAKLESIRSFCELGDYFDKPVRTYSSGMYVRLAFALATAVEPDILIVDEALSVGDAYFQQKCVRKMEAFKKQGVTILFVSHDLGILKLFCDRVALLQHGRIAAVGQTREILELYNAKLAEHSQGFALEEAREREGGLSSGNGKVRIEQVVLNTAKQQAVAAIEAGEECQIAIDVDFLASISEPTVGILIRDRLGYDVFGINTKLLWKKTGTFHAGDRARFHFALPMNIGVGEYTLTVALHEDSTHSNECYHWVDRILSFKVLPRADFQFLGVSMLTTHFAIERQTNVQGGSRETALQGRS